MPRGNWKWWPHPKQLRLRKMVVKLGGFPRDHETTHVRPVTVTSFTKVGHEIMMLIIIKYTRVFLSSARPKQFFSHEQILGTILYKVTSYSLWHVNYTCLWPSSLYPDLWKFLLTSSTKVMAENVRNSATKLSKYICWSNWFFKLYFSSTHLYLKFEKAFWPIDVMKR